MSEFVYVVSVYDGVEDEWNVCGAYTTHNLAAAAVVEWNEDEVANDWGPYKYRIEQVALNGR